MSTEREALIRIVGEPELMVIVEGDLDFAAAPQFGQAVESVLAEGCRFIVDLNGVGFIDSSGVAVLLDAKRRAVDAGGACELRGVSAQVRKTLQIGGFGRMFGIEPLRLEQSPSADNPMRSSLNRANWQIDESVVVGRPLLVTELRETAVEAAREAGLDESDVSDVKLAVGEALTNALKHAASPGRDKIRLRCLACPSALVVEISDQGHGFDPETIPPPAHGVLRGGGLGIHLMRSVMDEVDFSNEGGGSKVRMLKWIRDNDN